MTFQSLLFACYVYSFSVKNQLLNLLVFLASDVLYTFCILFQFTLAWAFTRASSWTSQDVELKIIWARPASKSIKSVTFTLSRGALSEDELYPISDRSSGWSHNLLYNNIISSKAISYWNFYLINPCSRLPKMFIVSSFSPCPLAILVISTAIVSMQFCPTVKYL